MKKRYVCGFMFDPRGEAVVLIEKTRPQWQRGLLNGLGGEIEGRETPLQAMVREFFEETGVETTTTDWRVLATLEGPGYHVTFFHTHSDQYRQVSGRTDESVTIQFAKALPRNVVPDLNWLIPLALDARVVKPLHVVDGGGS